MKPEVSVLMPVYNCGPFLNEAIASITEQTFRDFELIIIDDGSTDNTAAQLQGWARRDERIQFQTRPNTGIVGALNEGLQLARGKWIARMDGDDWCARDRLGKQVAFMKEHPGVLACGTGLLYTDPKGRPLYEMRPATNGNEIERQLRSGHSMAIVHATAIFDAVALKRTQYREAYKYIEDLDLFLRLCQIGKLSNLPEVLYSYRQHPGGTNAQKARQQTELKRKLLAEFGSVKGGVLALPGPSPSTRRELYADWSCKAFLGGNRRTGFVYAFRFLGESGFDFGAWGQFLRMVRLGLGTGRGQSG